MTSSSRPSDLGPEPVRAVAPPLNRAGAGSGRARGLRVVCRARERPQCTVMLSVFLMLHQTLPGRWPGRQRIAVALLECAHKRAGSPKAAPRSLVCRAPASAILVKSLYNNNGLRARSSPALPIAAAPSRTHAPRATDGNPERSALCDGLCRGVGARHQRPSRDPGNLCDWRSPGQTSPSGLCAQISTQSRDGRDPDCDTRMDV